MTSNLPSSYSIRLVFQRYRKARIVLDEDDSKIVTLGGSEMPLLIFGCDGTNTNTCGEDSTTTTSPTTPKTTKTLGVVVYVSFSSKLSSSSSTPSRPDRDAAAAAAASSDAAAVIDQAAKTILQLPIHTFGRWGDGRDDGDDGHNESSSSSSSSKQRNQTQSLLQILSSQQHNNDEQQTMSPISLLIVPQANLISKVYKNGKSIQYRDQISPKHLGQEMYDKLCNTIQRMLIDHQIECRNVNNSTGSKQKQQQVSATTTTPDPSIPPNELFRRGRYEGIYATYDPSTGIPLTLMVNDKDDNNGQQQEEETVDDTISKSARKKLQKIYDAHIKRHEKWKLKQKQRQQQQQQQQLESKVNDDDDGGGGGGGCDDDGQDVEQEQSKTATEAGIPNPSENDGKSKTKTTLDPSFVQFVAASFGKRQGLELFSDMGPFCHIVDI